MAVRLNTFVTKYVSKSSFIYIGAGLSLAAISALALSENTPNKQAEPAEIRSAVVAQVHSDSGALTSLTGVVQSDLPLAASSPTGGKVMRLLANVGDRVTAGQPLAILDATAAALRVRQADAEFARLAALASERASAATRASGLVDSGSMSAAERDAIAAEAKSARAAAAAAGAARAAIAWEAGQAVVRAPASGIIAERLAELGSVAAPGQRLFAIEGTGQRIILAAAPQRLARELSLGSTVSFSAEGEEGSARIAGISPRVADGGVVPVRLVITAGAPLPGSVVRVGVDNLSGSATVRVPVGSITLDHRRQAYVLLLDQSSHALRLNVNVLGFAGNEARIQGQLRPGQVVVAAGAAFISPGEKVTPARPGL